MDNALKLFEENLGLAYELWRRYKDLWPPSEQEDLLQEALIAFWQSCRRHDPKRGALSTIAYLVVRHRLLNLCRRRRRRAHVRFVPLEVLLEEGEERDPLPAPVDVHDAAMARMAWRRLPPELRLLAVMTQKEVAATCGMPRSTMNLWVQQVGQAMANGEGLPDRPKPRRRHARLFEKDVG